MGELRALSVALVAGSGVALERANAYRQLPPVPVIEIAPDRGDSLFCALRLWCLKQGPTALWRLRLRAGRLAAGITQRFRPRTSPSPLFSPNLQLPLQVQGLVPSFSPESCRFLPGSGGGRADG